jgi:tetratricopeptide (TPR) repeat protein
MNTKHLFDKFGSDKLLVINVLLYKTATMTKKYRISKVFLISFLLYSLGCQIVDLPVLAQQQNIFGSSSRESARRYFQKGFDAMHENNDQQAIRYFNEAVRLMPDYSRAYNLRGFAKRRIGDLKGALEDFNQAIKINKNWETAKLHASYNNRGQVKAMLGDVLDGIKDFDRAIEIYPDYADGHKNRGIAKASLGLKQEALSDFQKAAYWHKLDNNLEEYEKVLEQIRGL